jgi:hypothetical protein
MMCRQGVFKLHRFFSGPARANGYRFGHRSG